MSVAVEIPPQKVEVVVHEPPFTQSKETKETESKKATMELLATFPEDFETGALQHVALELPSLSSTEAAIIMEAIPLCKTWKEFVIFIFQIYPHDRPAQNLKRVDKLWKHVCELQGKSVDDDDHM